MIPIRGFSVAVSKLSYSNQLVSNIHGMVSNRMVVLKQQPSRIFGCCFAHLPEVRNSCVILLLNLAKTD